jgi:hypothetical protein
VNLKPIGYYVDQYIIVFDEWLREKHKNMQRGCLHSTHCHLPVSDQLSTTQEIKPEKDSFSYNLNKVGIDFTFFQMYIKS